MQRQDDGTFIWQNEDIITADMMNSLLLEDNVVILEEQNGILNTSYKDLINYMKNKKIVFFKRYKEQLEDDNNKITYQFLYLKQLAKQEIEGEDSNYFVFFYSGSNKESSLLFTSTSEIEKLRQQPV